MTDLTRREDALFDTRFMKSEELSEKYANAGDQRRPPQRRKQMLLVLLLVGIGSFRSFQLFERECSE